MTPTRIANQQGPNQRGPNQLGPNEDARTQGPARLPVVLVTGLSGSGKLSVLGALEDLGFETMDNPPLEMLADMVACSERGLAIGVDARTRGFDATRVLETLATLRADPGLRPELVYVCADEATLLRRYTENRRRHPLAPQGRVAAGIAQEQVLTGRLRDAADLVVDTSDLPIGAMRRRIEQHFGADTATGRLVVTLVSFAYPKGLPPEADLVFDARFLRNPHYDPMLRSRTGLDCGVGACIETDPDFGAFFNGVAGLVDLLLPRFVQEGKKYATIAIGCTGGRHRSVYLVEKLAARLTTRPEAHRAAGESGWRLHVMHRELARETSAAASPGGATLNGATPNGASQVGAAQNGAAWIGAASIGAFSTGRTRSRGAADGEAAGIASAGGANGDRVDADWVNADRVNVGGADDEVVSSAGATDSRLGAWPLPAQAQEA